MLIQIAYLLLAAFALGFIIFIHELAHYLMAKRVGMKVEAFSIGFGAAIYSWERKGEQWRIGWLPFGGYVKVAGEKKEDGKEPHEVEGGYFSKKPIDRIKFAGIAPVTNLVFALLMFTVIWLLGGRDKPFHDLTNRIGWLDTKSELYQEGIRPGDEITLYNDRKFHGFKDIFQSTMMSKDCVRVKGYHYNYLSNSKTPFDVTVKTYQHPLFQQEGIMTAGILGPANYLIYNTYNGQPNPIMAGSPMASSGLDYGDRIIWADGELIFSNQQLQEILNSQHTLVTFKRQNEVKLARLPLAKIQEYKLSNDYRSELGDIKYEAKVKGRLNDLLTIPYQLNPNLEVYVPLRMIDTESDLHNYSSSSIETQLLTGDQIMAIDGQAVSSQKELLTQLQKHKFNIIVQSGNQNLPVVSWQQANNQFESNVDFNALQTLAQKIGTTSEVQQDQNLKLLQPVSPMTMSQIAENANRADWTTQLLEQRAKISEIKDPQKREAALKLLNAQESRLYLGVSFQDRKVEYNPSPFVTFGRVTGDIFQTLKALITGNLSPKWLSGPVGIVQVMQQGWSLGVKEALYWLALISLNLGFMNLLPIPVLDGGHICFALYEQITRKPLKAKTMERIIIPFMVLFIGFFVFVTFHDLSRLIKGIF